MPFRDRLSLALPPLLLRLALAATFLWAGSGKLFRTAEFSPEQAAVLANAGVSVPGALAGPGPTDTDPGPTPAPTPAPTPDSPDDNAEPGDQTPADADPPVDPPAADPPSADPGPDQPLPDPAEEGGGTAMGAGVFMLAQNAQGARVYTAEDFDGPVEKRGLYNIFFVLHSASQPQDGGRSLVPAALSSDAWKVRLAWASAITEFLGGLFVLVGLLTRLSALGLAGVMVGAIWLTSIGPVAFGGANTASLWGLGFLPPLAEFRAWQTFMFQFTTLMAALALVLGRPGILALDQLIFGSPRRRRANRQGDE